MNLELGTWELMTTVAEMNRDDCKFVLACDLCIISNKIFEINYVRLSQLSKTRIMLFGGIGDALL